MEMAILLAIGLRFAHVTARDARGGDREALEPSACVGPASLLTARHLARGAGDKALLRVLGSVEERIPRKARERLLRQESGAVE